VYAFPLVKASLDFVEASVAAFLAVWSINDLSILSKVVTWFVEVVFAEYKIASSAALTSSIV
jgi:hypothetical protein